LLAKRPDSRRASWVFNSRLLYSTMAKSIADNGKAHGNKEEAKVVIRDFQFTPAARVETQPDL